MRAYCPPLARRVAGAADFRLGLQNYNANLALPAGFVIPLDQDSDGPQNMVGIWQVVRKTIGIIVEFDATPDRRGQVPAMSYDAMEAALFHALLNWLPIECRSPNGQGYSFVGGRFLDLDRARLFYQWEFGLAYQLDDTDGWQPESEWLRRIEVDIHKAPLSEHPDPAAVVHINTMGTTWDGDQTIWDAGRSDWDLAW
ncbi:MAG TPA: hypothetical protein VLN57_19435 [Xanthobacteraceae bacterium]|nr:hypothetical protein [Xanthobacteraceae bacterium]